MSTRIPRLWHPGQPRPRVFLPDFWIKLLETTQVGVNRLPPYAALFEVDPRMSRLDVREYLEKIYQFPVRDVRVYNKFGEIEWMWPKDIRNRRATWKEDDRKMAFVFFRKDFVVKYPNLFATTTEEEEERKIREQNAELGDTPQQRNERFANRDRAGVGRLLN